jgi:type IV pilus assembly protein PilQ
VITLNSFTGQAASGEPPPRQTNSVQSEVTVPDGDTIVVGGLNSTNISDTVNRVPVVGQIPLLQYLFSNRTNSSDHSTLFVFIRPVILRDDLFRDLKFLSQQQIKEAGLPSDLPESQPLLIE